jgi:tRNA pseudouridine38-40 synthase
MTIEYDGRGFVGWQRQDNGPSVQQALEEAVTKFCGEAARLHGAGRTDAGVHALGQVAHLDLKREAAPDVLRDAVNFHLKPAAVAVIRAEGVDGSFDARLSAKSRAYLYRIINRRAPLALERGRAWQVGAPLDHQAMHRAAQLLVGRHDFSAFRASLCQAKSPVKTLDVLDVGRAKSPVKTLDVLDVGRDGDEIRVVARARSFLHHQVRNMVGTLKLVGEGKWTEADVAAALEARERAAAGPTAPAEGLYLTEVLY